MPKVKISHIQKLNPTFPLQWPIKKRDFIKWYWAYECAYCGLFCGENSSNLQIDHIVARSRGGSNHVSNLIPACVSCNKRKGCQTLSDFLSNEIFYEIIRLNVFYFSGYIEHLYQNALFDLLAKQSLERKLEKGGRSPRGGTL